jgi:hypothetical protein
MSESGAPGRLPDEEDPVLERIVRDRREGEIESGMLSGSDEGELSATDRFAGELSQQEALEALDPAHAQHG